MTALTIDQLRAALTHVTYRPGWRFDLYEHQWEGVWLAVTADLDDAYRPGEMVTVCVRSAVPPIPTAAYFLEWLAWRLWRIESHECREWLRIDGAPIHDPHSAEANDAVN